MHRSENDTIHQNVDLNRKSEIHHIPRRPRPKLKHQHRILSALRRVGEEGILQRYGGCIVGVVGVVGLATKRVISQQNGERERRGYIQMG